MKFIAHRINTLAELNRIPPEYGVEVDLRDYGDRLIMAHDPFQDGEDFEPFARAFKHGTLILNIKSERIEHRVLDIIHSVNIKDYFFLDSSFPMIHLMATNGEQNIAVRFSEFEGMDTILAMQGRISWVWVDCFTEIPITKEIEVKLHGSGFKLCFVSPELQGRPEDIRPYRQYLAEENIQFDAVCTKLLRIPEWKETP